MGRKQIYLMSVVYAIGFLKFILKTNLFPSRLMALGRERGTLQAPFPSISLYLTER